MTLEEEIKNCITACLSQSEVVVTGDGHHFEAVIISPDFIGKSTLERHRMVYAALGDRMREQIHALSMRTLTPNEISK